MQFPEAKVFLYLFHRRTYYMDMGNIAAAGAPKCIVDATVGLAGRVQDLSCLKDLLVDTEVVDTWEFKVLGEPASDGGVCITMPTVRKLMDLAPRPPRNSAEDLEDGDSEEAEIEDVISGGKVVDTDDEQSEGSLASSSSWSSKDPIDNYIIAKPLELESEPTKGTGYMRIRARYRATSNPYYIYAWYPLKH